MGHQTGQPAYANFDLSSTHRALTVVIPTRSGRMRGQPTSPGVGGVAIHDAPMDGTAVYGAKVTTVRTGVQVVSEHGDARAALTRHPLHDDPYRPPRVSQRNHVAQPEPGGSDD